VFHLVDLYETYKNFYLVNTIKLIFNSILFIYIHRVLIMKMMLSFKYILSQIIK